MTKHSSKHVTVCGFRLMTASEPMFWVQEALQLRWESQAGIASAMIFGSLGAAYGTAKAGIGIANVGTFRPDLIMKSLVPVVMAGIIAVYGLVVAVLIAGDIGTPAQNYSLYAGSIHLAAGLAVGLSGLAAGYAIGIVGDAPHRCVDSKFEALIAILEASGAQECPEHSTGELGWLTFSTCRREILPFSPMATETIPQTQEQLSKPPPSDQHRPEIDPGQDINAKKIGFPPWPASRPKTPPDIVENRKHIKERIPKHKLKIEDFELLKTLGTGTFARVWLVRLKNPKDKANSIFALKILRKADVIELKQVEHVKNENRALHAVAGHPFITTLIASFSDDQCLYMLLDFCPGGEIFSFLRRVRRFNESTAQFYAAEISANLLIEDPNPLRIYEQIIEGRLRFPPHVSPEARDIIKRLGHISGGTQRIKDHPFFKVINWDDLYRRRRNGPIIPRVDHAADAGNFEEYPPPPDPSTQSVYTDEMRRKYEGLFKDFDDS
ncbi:vacuolar ATP synthase 16 kDa proteolipid subunit 2 [Uncinocarpus reesii 1704]|uniref:V-type proton ATPase proteolipid subunit n=1 Tax=Uncinocarpus reesii (strain UAMH 1704) TaxID=336963 RepID=C4JLI1_UNCRE|nr:vacuolar ATP synthase 16 kDa proteolipid subunit 2 [Uncinocarpus reesii 1704]EEP78843.1 vacuolar ATP synthase 16 kDa proteolipid subunit 2 [Uncinocarpus reesii 1704]